MLKIGQRLRASTLASMLFAMIFIAGCARIHSSKPLIGLDEGFWTGRLSLQIQSDPVQSFHAGFELKGRADKGELTLISPLGSTLGVLRWSPEEAVLDPGNHSLQRFESIDALTAHATGAAIPMTALFAWLRGDNATASGWSADLSRQSEGRVSAQRTQPKPEATLRVILDQ